MARSRRVAKTDDSDVNVTPLLDIVFIMLIFFIVTATFIKEPGVDVTRPEAQTAEDQRLVSILVAIDSENTIWINREEVSVDGVRAAVERLRRENPRGSAVIQADGAAHSEYLVDVLEQIRAAGVQDVVAVSTVKS
ncbi:MAG: biopolymer transporter ExbD [Wenzhouxiangellaceae bacterium]|nr:biopolymer transporter ExbD [Wenzhouxiangellaceae bacterium]MBS3746982.1 biopolymer transporter ExbD [Wenzhouxiangellaceae bacterium]MBS3822320.1 biopolymer transporter ExbD [Wenzhouxiangellaceae bacterium]